MSVIERESVEMSSARVNPSLRIAFIGQRGLPARWGGIEAHVEALALGLAERGHRVTVYARRRYCDGAGPPGVELKMLPTLYTKHTEAAVHSALSAFHSALQSHDIVHFHALGPCLFCWLPKLGRAKIVATIHCLDHQQKRWGPLARMALRFGEQLALHVPHRTIVVSRTLQEHYRDRGVDTDYLPNGTEPADPAPPDLITTDLGLSGGDYLLSLSRWTTNKRIDQLVLGYRLLQDPPFKLVVAGLDPYRDVYGSQVRRLAAGTAGILFPGEVRGQLKRELLSNARGFITASDHEGLPIALLEAMNYGRASIANDIPPHRELLDGSDAGVIEAMTTPESLADAMTRFEELGAARRSEMGRNAQSRVKAGYHWDRIVEQLEETYRQVLA